MENEEATMKFEETELRLGLPGGGGKVEGDLDHVHGVNITSRTNNNNNNNNGCITYSAKRGFEETDHIHADDHMEYLKLNLSSSKVPNHEKASMKMPPSNIDSVPKPPPAKAQVVGWPPVRSFRKNILAVQKSSEYHEKEREKVSSNAPAAFVKVSMDGAPYLRKVDLKMYKSYQELSDALGNMFCSFSTIVNCGSSQGIIKDFMNIERKLMMDLFSGTDHSDCVPTYEDKDGDWMLVGDVPWEMFVDSCKRLRIMKGTEAKGLAPRAVEKSRNRS